MLWKKSRSRPQLGFRVFPILWYFPLLSDRGEKQYEDIYMKPWVIFDADNTLWRLEPLYDAARQKLVDYLRKKGCNPIEVERFQRSRDAELFKWWGYHKIRFPLSFQDTAEYFLQKPTDREMKQIIGFAQNVFEDVVEPFEGAENTLVRLSKEFDLGIVTSGDAQIQAQRMASFRLADFFDEDHRMIVDQKDADTFRKFCRDRAIKPQSSWVVGDSLRSDVIPAVDAGMKAVHIGNDNWHEIERQGLELPTGAFHVNSINEVPDVVLMPD